MSRSRKKSPVITFVNISEKEDKRRGNRKLRKKAKQLLKEYGEDAIMPIMDEILDKWDMAKDDFRGWTIDATDKDLRK